MDGNWKQYSAAAHVVLPPLAVECFFDAVVGVPANMYYTLFLIMC